ncbi:MAG: response regulator transcription factor [Flavobacteriales bacterium]|nr:response regulator transcription factor [Flavobacteriales bacterium]
MAPPPIPIALIDDHNLFRSVLAQMLDGTTHYKVVVEAEHGGEYLRAVKNGAKVAVAVVDLHMPIMDGYATIAWIRANTPGTRAIALTFELGEEAMARALQAGACGFLRKNIGKHEFLDALNQVVTVGHYHSPSELEDADALREEHARKKSDALAQLTERELEFIRWVCDEEELTHEQVAERMMVHRRTADGFREGAYEKCGVKTKAGLVVFAHKWGIVH